MRTCPKCSAFYADDLTAFCLVDGMPLVKVDPSSDRWNEGSRAIEEKEKGLRKQKRRLKWRWIVASAMTALILTMVIASSVTIETSPVYKISGRVTDNGKAIPGLNIKLSGIKNASTATRPDGSYTFSGLPTGGPYTITPDPRIKFTSPSQTFENLTKDESADFRREVYKINGRVTDDGKAIPGLNIELTGIGIRRESTTRPDGNYTFSDVPAGGPYTITPDPTIKFTSPSQTIENLTKDESADFRREVYKISGRVTDNGKAVPGLNIKLTGIKRDSTITRPDGNYTFGGVPAGGPHTITPNSKTKFTSPSPTIKNLTKDELVNFEREQPDPQCSRDDEILEKGIIKRRFSELFRSSIESELSAKLGLPTGLRPNLELTGIEPTFSHTCTTADVKVSYEWWLATNGRDEPKRQDTRAFTCSKIGKDWHCNLVSIPR